MNFVLNQYPLWASAYLLHSSCTIMEMHNSVMLIYMIKEKTGLWRGSDTYTPLQFVSRSFIIKDPQRFSLSSDNTFANLNFFPLLTASLL